MDEQETPLLGGNVSGVVRVGDTVRRAPGPWTPSVHHFLAYLETQGFEGAPRPFGFDEQGREVLSFVQGDVGDYPLPPYVWADDTLGQAARFLRRFHDATVDYRPPPGARWQLVYPDAARHEVMCHNDFAPYNMVFRSQKPAALIDFDFAGPGPRTWDIAYALYRFVPLSWEPNMLALGLADAENQRRRVRLFCDAYGLSATAKAELLDMIERRIDYLCAYLADGAARGDPACVRMVREGHLAMYRREIEAYRLHRSVVEESLLPR